MRTIRRICTSEKNATNIYNKLFELNISTMLYRETVWAFVKTDYEEKTARHVFVSFGEG